MQRCLQLAKLGLGHTQTNPMVGCVIVHQDQIIAEGYHHAFGKAHAEVEAFNLIENKTILKECDVYVNLEPCSFQGKTPACASLFEANPVQRLIVGMLDPNPKVAGRGLDRVKATGSQITYPVLQHECKLLNKAFVKSIAQKQPYVIAKWAQSADGFIGNTTEQVNISNSLVNTLTQQWRAQIDAYIIGNKTLKVDQPKLDSRLFKGKQPLRCVIGNQIDMTNPFFKGSSEGLLFSKNPIANLPDQFQQVLTLDPKSVLEELYKRHIGTLMIEGGSFTLNSFLVANLVDELSVITNNSLTLKEGVKAPCIPERFKLDRQEQFRDNTIAYYRL